MKEAEDPCTITHNAEYEKINTQRLCHKFQ